MKLRALTASPLGGLTSQCSGRAECVRFILDGPCAPLIGGVMCLLLGETVNAIEEIFVNTFVQKHRRERALLELGSESRRDKFLDRLCHDYAGVLDPRYLQPIPKRENEVVLLQRLWKSRGAKTCYVISSNPDVDGKDIPLDDAIKATMGFGSPSILICSPDSLAYFEAEQVKGPPPRYLLVKHGGT